MKKPAEGPVTVRGAQKPREEVCFGAEADRALTPLKGHTRCGLSMPLAMAMRKSLVTLAAEVSRVW